MERRRVVVASLVALAVASAGAAAVASQRDDPCERLRKVNAQKFDSFAEQQRAQADALTACYKYEGEQGR